MLPSQGSSQPDAVTQEAYNKVRKSDSVYYLNSVAEHIMMSLINSKTTGLFLHSLENVEYGKLDLELANGQIYNFEGPKPGPCAHLRLLQDGVLANMLLRGDIAFVEDYCAGKWSSNNISSLVEFGLRNAAHLDRFIYGSFPFGLLTRLWYLFSMNTKRGSKRNIRAHYDLGNDFYSLWLDPGMTYSSALFATESQSLLDAQNNKYDRILKKVGATAENVLEIGCGWGGFAERASATDSHNVTAITISPSQYEFATRRLEEKSSTATIQFKDYRDQTGRYDAIVSIEMFEAVGEIHWSTFFRKVKSLLQPKGKAVIQTIVIDDGHFESYRRGGDAIRSYIFPGGMLASPTRFNQEALKAGLTATDTFSFGQHYARTLDRWLSNFDAQVAAVRALNFDEAFIRLWRFYLGSCAGTFRAGRTDVLQLELRHV